MRTWGLFVAGIGSAAAACAAQAQERQLGPHEHGRGTLNIALEGSRLSMELEAPGMDIVGFEHAASTDTQQAALDGARKRLAAPQELFELPAAAGCVLADARVAVEAEDHDHEHGQDRDAGGGGPEDKRDGGRDHDGSAEPAGHEHSAFRAEYAFDCKAPAGLTSIAFGYFKAFAGAQKLDVTIITPRQQSQFEVSRARPRLDLGGIM